MFRRSVARVCLPLLFGAAVTALTVQAEPAPAEKKPTTPSSTDIAAKQLLDRQQRQLREYKAVAENLLALAQRMEKSGKVEDQDKAKLIRKALELGDNEGVENKFQTLLRTLGGKEGKIGLSDIGQAKGQNEELAKVLKQILDILMNDDEMARIREEKNRLEKMLADLKGIIRETKVTRAVTENGKGDPKKLSKEQERIAKNTNDLAKRMGAKDEAKDGKGGDGKDGKDGKGGDGKDGKGKDGKGGDGKDGKSKDGKGGDGKDGKGKDGKGGDGKGKDGKGGDGKGGDGKGKDGKGGDGKGGDGKGGDGQGKDGQGGEGQQGQPGQPGQKAPGADQVKKAVPDQEQAKNDIDKNKRPEAVEKQTEAIDKLTKAQQELEKRLKQLREEELERTLANLEARVAKMLQMQIEVKEATIAIDKIIQSRETKKPEKVDIQKSQTQADKEGEIVVEANKAIEILKGEGSSVAFPRIFEETVIDMVRVKERLNIPNVGADTQADEQSIIDALKEMLEALKKAQQELGKSPPGQPGQSGPPPDQKLLDEIAELKMIRNLQVRVNEKTSRKGRELKGQEQADEPLIKTELKDLSGRQIKIEEMARDIASGKNK